jgi:hypothetical protein
LGALQTAILIHRYTTIKRASLALSIGRLLRVGIARLGTSVHNPRDLAGKERRVADPDVPTDTSG